MSSIDNTGTGSAAVVMNALQKSSVSSRALEDGNDVNVHASLPILADGYEMKENLAQCMKRNKTAWWLLKASANYWPDQSCPDENLSSTWITFHQTMFVTARVFLIVLVILYTVLLADGMRNPFGISVLVTIILDIISLFPAQYSNQLRLRQSARIQEALVVDECSKIALYNGAVFLATAMAFVIVYMATFGKDWRGAAVLYVLVFIAAEIALCGYLTFNLFILLMDVKVASISIDQLVILAEGKCLTFATFNKVRTDIHRRVDISKWASDIIIVPCVASTIAIQVLFTDNKLVSYYSFALILFKELQFVAVAFWYVAQVNEKADSLTVHLSGSMWDAGVTGVADNDRLSIVTSSMLEPISFTLLFRRLSLTNVVLSFVGCGITMAVGVIKEALL
jgi:hypothetical protein